MKNFAKYGTIIVVYNIKYIQIYLHICINQMHKYCILSIQQCEMLFIYSKFKIFYPGFCNLPSSLRAHGVSFTLLGLPIVKWISNFKQQPIVGGQYFNVPNPTESG